MPSARGPPIAPQPPPPSSPQQESPESSACRLRSRVFVFPGSPPSQQECNTMAKRKDPTYIRKPSTYDRKPAAQKRPYTPPPVRSYADLTPTVKRGDLFFFTAPSLSVSGK